GTSTGRTHARTIRTVARMSRKTGASARRPRSSNEPIDSRRGRRAAPARRPGRRRPHRRRNPEAPALPPMNRVARTASVPRPRRRLEAEPDRTHFPAIPAAVRSGLRAHAVNAAAAAGAVVAAEVAGDSEEPTIMIVTLPQLTPAHWRNRMAALSA